MKKICFKHDYYQTGEFVGTPTDLISGRTKDFEKYEIICTCKKCGKQKSFKFKKEMTAYMNTFGVAELRSLVKSVTKEQ